MTRQRRVRVALAAAAAGLLIVTAVFLPPSPFSAPAPSWRLPQNEVRGVFHVHTLRSDGTGTVAEVAAAAARAGLQFVIITDHGDGTRVPDAPAYHSGVLCIDAVEISTTGGHYAALGLGRAPYPLAGQPGDVAEDVRRLGGFGIATHPLSEKADLAWRDWGVSMDALEWLSGDSLWRDAPAAGLARAAWTYIFRPVPSLARLYQRPATLARWDAMDPARRVIALAGTDAHARLGFRDGPEPYRNPVYLKLPSYRVAFSVASLRVRIAAPLGRNATTDAAAVIDAIRAGRVHTVVDGLGKGAAFDFTATSGGVGAVEGGQVALSDPAVIRVRSNPPPGGWVVLFRNGREVHRAQDQELVYATDQPGSYRAEVWVPSASRERLVPWIVGNPIVVGALKPRVTSPEVDAGGPSFPLATDSDMWGAEHDPRSQATVLRESGIGLAYTLAPAGGAAPYAALEATTAVTPGTAGVALVGRADRPMRLSVQVRVPTAGEGLRWQRSIYLEPTAREVFIPFAEMTALGDTPNGPPQLDGVRTVLFVVDTVNAHAGSTGHFVLDRVRFYSPTSRPSAKQ